MALVLVRLRLALLRSGLAAAGIRGTLGFAFAAVLAAAVGALAGLLLALTRAASVDVAPDIAAAAFAGIFLIWTLGPIVSMASDGTLPPERLAPFPLTARQLMPGLLLGGIAGFGGLASVLALTGAFVGFAPASPLVLVTVAALAVQLAICVIASRLVTTLLSGAARTRRWRDLALVIGPLIGVIINIGLQLTLRVTVDPATPAAARAERLAPLRVFVRLLPSGPPGLAVGYARQGRAAAAIGALVLAAAIAAAGAWAWHAALVRTLTSAGGESGTRAGRATSLFPWYARWLPKDRLGAVAAKELRLVWRDPRQRAALFGALFGPVAMMVGLRTLSSTAPVVVLLAASPAYFLGASSSNLFGFDGRATWTNVVAPGDAGADIVGKVVARALLALAITAVAVTALALRVHSASHAPAAFGLAIAGFGLTSGGGAVLSVRSPFSLPQSSTNVFSAGNSGQGLAQAGPALLLMFGTGFLLAPITIGLLVVSGAGGRTVLTALATGIGAAGMALGLHRSARYLRAHAPELLAALETERS